MSCKYVEGPENTLLVECLPHVRGSIYTLDGTRVIGHDSLIPFDPV